MLQHRPARMPCLPAARVFSKMPRQSRTDNCNMFPAIYPNRANIEKFICIYKCHCPGAVIHPREGKLRGNFLSFGMITVAVGILFHDGKILVCQRSRSSRYPLKWEFPGGKIEPAETPDAGLRRELMEELSIDATIDSLFDRQHSSYPDGREYDVYYYFVRQFNGTLNNRVFEAIEWIDVRDIPGIDFLEGNNDIVQKLIQWHDAPTQS